MKWMKNLLFWQKDDIVKAGEASIKQYRELYEKLDAYDKGDLPEAKIFPRSKDLRDVIRAS